MPILAIEQPPTGWLVQVLEPMRTDNHRLRQRGLEEVAIGRPTVFFTCDFQWPRPEWPTIAGAKLELGNQHRLVQFGQASEVVTVLGLEGIEVEAQHIAELGAGLDRLWRAHGIATAEQQVIGRMPLQRVGDGLEVGLGEHLLEVLVIPLNFRVLGVGHGRLETRVFHQFPGGQFDPPGLGQPLLIAVLVP
ncbi:hypothetical protein D3C81_1159320 [compost metagenome]